jgi:hypothetical protein
VPSDRPVFELAFEELFLEFTENCKKGLTNGAEERLETFFEETIQGHLEAREVEWDGRIRRFCLSVAAGLAREAERTAGNAQLVTVEHIDVSTLNLLAYWERICPLPEALGEPLGEDCTRLRNLLRVEPSGPRKKKTA